MKKIILIPFIIIFLISCANVNYIAPDIESLSNEPFTVELNDDFDNTWSKLIDYAGRTFYAIDNFEKNSGLMTLTFSTQDLSNYITGGHFDASSIAENYSGDYADFLQNNRNGRLTGRINLVVQSIDQNNTKITVNTRYVVEASRQATDQMRNVSWTFNTNGYDIVGHGSGSNPNRVLMPTHNLENEILLEVSK